MTEQQGKLDRRDLQGTAAVAAFLSRSGVVPYLAVAVMCTFLAVVIWHVRSIDLTVPLGVNGDHNLSQELVTNFVRDGHYYVNPLLGAPGEQELYDYPLPHWVHFSVLAGIRVFTHNPGLAINLLFFLGYPLAGITALYAFRKFGISTGLAMAGAVLYAFIPFHQMRNEAHLIYACYYLVPLMALVLVWISTGHELFLTLGQQARTSGVRITRDGIISLLVCFLIGWDNPYTAFFGIVLLAVGGLLGRLRGRNPRSLIAAFVLSAVIIVSFGVGLLPNVVYIHNHGRTTTATRIPSESEMYGLTLIQMLAPVTNHRIHRLAEWKDRFLSQAVMVNGENESSALGAVGAVGCVVLLVCLFLPNCPEILYSLSILNLFAFLMGTIGGLGAIFSFVVSPQLRGFSRVTVYIAFFCIAASMIVLDYIVANGFGKRNTIVGLIAIPSLILVVGIYDQVPKGLTLGRDRVGMEFRAMGEFVRNIESLVPPNSMIFQLPYDPFPESPPINRMNDYEELKGYLHSKSLRWSYGAMKGREVSKWQAAITAEPTDKMLIAVAKVGFAGIYVDRFGYPDGGALLESQLRKLLGNEPIRDKSGRLAFFLLDSRAANSLIGPEQRSDLEGTVYPLVLEPGGGCWGKEGTESENWHWCPRQGTIDILNTSRSQRKVVIEASFSTPASKSSNLVVDGPGIHQELKVNNGGTHWLAEVTVTPGDSTINLSSDASKLIAPNDPRDLYFQINNFRFHEVAR
jgi:phosphoglycerol transferase